MIIAKPGFLNSTFLTGMMGKEQLNRDCFQPYLHPPNTSIIVKDVRIRYRALFMEESCHMILRCHDSVFV